jgi:hypothetical protein
MPWRFLQPTTRSGRTAGCHADFIIPPSIYPSIYLSIRLSDPQTDAVNQTDFRNPQLKLYLEFGAQRQAHSANTRKHKMREFLARVAIAEPRMLFSEFVLHASV